MAIINDPKTSGTRYYFLGREKRNVTGWAKYMDRAEFKAYKNPAEWMFYEKRERTEEGGEVIRFYFGRRYAPLGQGPKEAFRIERNRDAYERYRDMCTTVTEF
ncbi:MULTISPECIES: hypothetical protein [Streptomyces]